MLDTKSIYFYIIAISVLFSYATNFGYSNLLEPFLFLKNNGSFYPSFENTYLISMEWWRLITPTFLHFSFTHLIFNCLWIYILGSKIEIIDGKGIFITLFLITGLSSNLGQYFWTGNFLFGGLSGAVYGLLLAYGITYPNRLVYLYGIFPIKVKFMVIGMGIAAFFASVIAKIISIQKRSQLI